MLELDQFTLIVMLVNTALQDSVDVDMHRVVLLLYSPWQPSLVGCAQE